tara:strand:+ start:397 stop:933 length:537 start_codon:yes stop_codon:yes gene_type:complete
MKIYNVKSDNVIIVGEYSFHKELKEELLPLLENYPDEMGRKTSVKATMTEYDWDPKSDRLERLKNNILEFANYNCSFKWSSSGGVYARYFMTDFWANIYRKGDYTLSHDHRPQHLSFVYFLKTKWYYSPLVFSDSGKKIRPKEGTFVIFPSHMYHFVHKHRYGETRMTLSGNMRIKES